MFVAYTSYLSLKTDLPARKYRDEPRPRQGLLRAREFLMKDLYTFDADAEDAMRTYKSVRQAYTAFFNEMKMPYITVAASSGNIGGNLSHEYHYVSPKGEDNIISCTHCDYAANEELAQSRANARYSQPEVDGSSSLSEKPLKGFELVADNDHTIDSGNPNQWLGISRDGRTLIQAFVPSETEVQTSSRTISRKSEVNPYAIKMIFQELDLSVENPLSLFEKHIEERGAQSTRVVRVLDRLYLSSNGSLKMLPESDAPSYLTIGGSEVRLEYSKQGEYPLVDLIRISAGDPCPKCDQGTLKVQKAVELGHTFHLGTRYSMPLNARIAADPSRKISQKGADDSSLQNTSSERPPIQMGCHGIGISRLIAVVADLLADSKGLQWPSVMAPFEAVIISSKGLEPEATEIYDLLTRDDESMAKPIDAILEDRNKDFIWKLKDADLIGYPVIVIVGRDWKEKRCEVQCRRLNVKESVPVNDLQAFVASLLEQL